MSDGRAIRVCIAGASGRMGAVLVSSLRDSADLKLTAATERTGSVAVGRDIGGVVVSDDFAAALATVDVAIDFTSPEASLRHAELCASRAVPLVLGTTGFDAAGREALAGFAKTTPLVHAPNFSIGVNVLIGAVFHVARTLGAGFDVEVVETHHRLKKDAPSGTALRLAEAAANALGIDRSALVHARDGLVGERPQGTIGIQAIRGGDVVGDHSVHFLGDGERLEFTHRAESRATFAAGALRAARWIVGQPPGLYDMLDVLGSRWPGEAGR